MNCEITAAEDMLHPNQVAIDYIWKRFVETTISETAFAVMEEVESIQKNLSHNLKILKVI
jgi:hypothetical protein